MAAARHADASAAPAATLRQLATAARAAVVANVGIVVTGGIVRLSDSGLGCEDWPTCDGTSIAPTGREEAGWHTWIEFGNRLLTFLVLATAIWVVIAARRHAMAGAGRPGTDLRRLAWLQPVGVLGQAVLGGITVLTDLNPLVVAAHFLLSMAVIAAAVVLLERARPTRPLPVRGLRHLAVPLLVVGAAVLVLGTLVTAAGPHAGDPGTPRLALDIRSLAFAHADAVWLLVGLTVATLLASRALGAERAARTAAVLLLVELAQGGVGYAQYALGIPEPLVAVHLLGAATTWVMVLRTAMAVAPGGDPVVGADTVEGHATATAATAAG